MSDKLIYLASPYSHEDPAVRERRYQDALHATTLLFKQGLFVYSPIAYCHAMATDHAMDGAWASWQAFDKLMVDRCDELWVLDLDGWIDSVGVTAEVGHAGCNGKPIFRIRHALLLNGASEAEWRLTYMRLTGLVRKEDANGS